MSDIVRRYYDRMADTEWSRLEGPYRSFEWVSTWRLIDEHFPAAGRIADIGGGPGRYTIELLSRGYDVTLLDLSPKHIELARRKLEDAGFSATVLCADAADLSCLQDAAFDAALMLGPMYHIIDDGLRGRALRELHRILKPGAPAIVGFINPWGILRSGLTEFPEAYRDAAAAGALLDTCVQAGEQDAFTEAAFLSPPRALQELREAGLAVETRAGVEGFAAGMLDAVESIAAESPEALENIRRMVAETCELPAYRDCTEHLHVVVRKIG